MKNMKKILAGLTLGVMVMGATALSIKSAEAFGGMHGYGGRGGYHTNYSEMTDAQKAEVKARYEQRMEWHKKDLQLAVDAGKITQKEADERIARMQSRYKDMQDGKMGMRHNYKEGRHNYKGDRNGHGYYRDGHGGSTDCPRY